jgi:hypothetical protein
MLRRFHHRDHQVLAVEVEPAEHLAADGRRGDPGCCDGGHAERAPDPEGTFELAGEVLVEETDHDRQLGSQALSVERDLDVDDVFRRGHDEGPRLQKADPPEDVRIAGVGDLHLDSGGTHRLDPVVVAGLRDHDHFLPQPVQQLDRPVAHDPQAADDVMSSHPALFLPLTGDQSA